MSKSNVYYNGVDLSDASPYFELIDIRDSGVDVTPTAINPPRGDGQIFASVKRNIRVITVVFSILDDNEAARAKSINKLNEILRSTAPQELRLPIHAGRYLNALCTTIPQTSVLDWTEELAVQFTAYDPFYYSYSDAIGATLTNNGSVNVYVNCTGSMRPIITQTIAAALTDPTWTCSNGQMIMLQGTVAVGTLTIDCEKRLITHSANDSIMAQLTLDSTFFDLAPATAIAASPYVISCTNGAAGSMSGRQRWL